jgi:hypothetical protein
VTRSHYHYHSTNLTELILPYAYRTKPTARSILLYKCQVLRSNPSHKILLSTVALNLILFIYSFYSNVLQAYHFYNAKLIYSTNANYYVPKICPKFNLTNVGVGLAGWPGTLNKLFIALIKICWCLMYELYCTILATINKAGRRSLYEMKLPFYDLTWLEQVSKPVWARFKSRGLSHSRGYVKLAPGSQVRLAILGSIYKLDLYAVNLGKIIQGCTMLWQNQYKNWRSVMATGRHGDRQGRRSGRPWARKPDGWSTPLNYFSQFKRLYFCMSLMEDMISHIAWSRDIMLVKPQRVIVVNNIAIKSGRYIRQGRRSWSDGGGLITRWASDQGAAASENSRSRICLTSFGNWARQGKISQTESRWAWII